MTFMRTPEQQLAGLKRLAKYMMERWEVNCGISPAGSDVAFLQMLTTPRGSQAVYANGPNDSYDIWAWTPTGYDLQKSNLSLAETADVLKTEYFTAKAACIKAHSPHMDINEIMQVLERGYQRGE